VLQCATCGFGCECFLHGLVMLPNEEEFLWRAADTKTLLNGTARHLLWNFNPVCAAWEAFSRGYRTLGHGPRR
jgi:hypothetical protein